MKHLYVLALLFATSHSTALRAGGMNMDPPLPSGNSGSVPPANSGAPVPPKPPGPPVPPANPNLTGSFAPAPSNPNLTGSFAPQPSAPSSTGSYSGKPPKPPKVDPLQYFFGWDIPPYVPGPHDEIHFVTEPPTQNLPDLFHPNDPLIQGGPVPGTSDNPLHNTQAVEPLRPPAEKPPVNPSKPPAVLSEEEAIAKLAKELAGKPIPAELRAKLNAKIPGLLPATLVVLTNEDVSRILHQLLEKIRLGESGITAADLALFVGTLDQTSQFLPKWDIGDGKLTFTFTFNDQIVDTSETSPFQFSASLPVNTEVIDAAKPVIGEVVNGLLNPADPPPATYRCCLCNITEKCKNAWNDNWQECAKLGQFPMWMDHYCWSDASGKTGPKPNTFDAADGVSNTCSGSSYHQLDMSCQWSSDEKLCMFGNSKFNLPKPAPSVASVALHTTTSGIATYVAGSDQGPTAPQGVCQGTATCKRDTWINSECDAKFKAPANSIDACLNWINSFWGNGDAEYMVAMQCKSQCGGEYMLWGKESSVNVLWKPN